MSTRTIPSPTRWAAMAALVLAGGTTALGDNLVRVNIRYESTLSGYVWNEQAVSGIVELDPDPYYHCSDGCDGGMDGSGRAQLGRLEAYSRAWRQGAGDSSFGRGASDTSLTVFRLENIIVSAPGVPDGTPVTISANLSLMGELTLTPPSNDRVNATSQIFVRLFHPGGNTAGIIEIGWDHEAGAVTLQTQLMLDGQGPAVDGVFTSAPFIVWTGLPFQLELELRASSGAGGFGGGTPLGTVESTCEFVGGFPLSGPVLNLPPGYTANSAEGTITDNLLAGAPCPADWNADGDVTSADITSFLSDWFSDLANGTTVADYDISGATTSADITAFLAAWFEALAAGGC